MSASRRLQHKSRGRGNQIYIGAVKGTLWRDGRFRTSGPVKRTYYCKSIDSRWMR